MLEESSPSQLTISNQPECIVASHRGPLEYYVENGEYKTRLGSGGLVTALISATRQCRLTWLALTMTETERLANQAAPQLANKLPPILSGTTLRLFSISEQAYQQFYDRISNQVLWFAQHSLLDPIRNTTFTKQTRTDWEEGYVVANQKLANAVIAELERWGPETPVLFQDYQLYLAPGQVRARYPQARLGHILYIPWSDPRYLAMLPDYIIKSIYQSLAMNDLLGFQTLNDARNFLAGAQLFLEDAHVEPAITANEVGRLSWRGRQVQVCLYPAMISAHYLRAVLDSQGTEQAEPSFGSQLPGQLIVRVDRIEPTKNIVRGFQAYERLLQKQPALHGQVSFLALLVPTRSTIPAYQAYEREVYETIARINDRYGHAHWQPIVTVQGNERARALAAMQDYDVLLVNPVIDGMNLVVKEGALLNRRAGVIILSRTVGVHDTLGEATLNITPLDIDATADALYEALTMPTQERQRRAARLQDLVEREDVASWFDQQITTLKTLIR